MASSLRQFGKESVIYSFGHILIRFVSFLLVPVYTNSFSQADYGTLSLIFTVIGFAQILYNYGMASSLMKFYAGKDNNSNQVVTTTFITLAGSALILSVIIWWLSPQLSHWLLGVDNPIWFKYIAGILFLDTISVRAMILLRFDNKAVKFTLFALTNVLVTIGANIFLVVKNSRGVTGAIEATLIAAAVSFVLVLPTLIRKLRLGSYSTELLMRMLFFGLPFIPAAFFQVMMDLSDRFLVDWLGGREMVGLYSAGYKLGSLMLIVVTGFNLGWQPYFLNKEKDPDAPELFARIAGYFSVFLVLVWMVFILFSDQLVRIQFFGVTLIGERFWASTGIIPVIMLGYIFLGLYDLLMPAIFYNARSRILPVYRALGAISNILLNLIFIPRWGIMGAAWATCISFGLMSVLLYFPAQKMFWIPFKWKFMGFQLGMGLTVYILSLVYNYPAYLRILIFIIYLLIVSFSLRKELRSVIRRR